MPEQPRGDDPRSAVIDELIKALQAFSVESDVFVDVFARAHGLGRSDLNAIMWISVGAQVGRPLSAGELAGKLGLGAPATTALVDRLEAVGHVRRTRDPRDRRRVTIDMQPAALAVAREFFIPLGRLMNDAVAGVDTDDLQRAAEIIRLMLTAVTAARAAATDYGSGRAGGQAPR